MSARRVTGEVSVWIRKDSGPDELSGEDQDVTNNIVTFGPDSNMSIYGYTKISDGEITFEVPDLRDLVDRKADSLRSEIQKARADAEVTVNRLESQLSKLLAIDFDGATT